MVTRRATEVKNKFCSSCGAVVKAGLSYCNHCGEEVNTKERKLTKQSDTSFESLIWAIVAVSVGGLAMLIGFAAVLKDVLQFDSGQIMGFIGFAFLMLMA